MLSSRLSPALFVCAALVACSSPTTTVAPPSDAGTQVTNEKCSDFTGFFLTLTEIADCNSYRATLPRAVCITQIGCDVTIATGGQILKGKAVDRKVSVIVETPVRTECAGEIADEELQLKCTSYVPLAREPYVCDFPTVRYEGTLETSYCCDPIAQNCGDGERCNLVALVSNSAPLAAVCLPTNGSVAAGEACQRFGAEESNAGNDDCAEGLFCSRVGVANSADRLCRKLCSKESECGSGETCYGVSENPVAGFCLPTCEPFGDGCGDGTTCRRLGALDDRGEDVVRWACTGTGSVALGSNCGADTDCGSGAVCIYRPGDRNNPKCRTLCDKDHPCGGPSLNCIPYDPDEGSAGVCATR